MYLQVSTICGGRLGLSDFLMSVNLNTFMVEVGVHQAEFASQFLIDWSGKYFGIDPWSVPTGYEEQAKTLKSSKSRERDLSIAGKRLSLFKPNKRVELIKSTSTEAAPLFADDSLDFVYIDGDHRYEQVLEDLELWYEKVKPSGMLAGHDYTHPGISCNNNFTRQVQRAVQVFSTRHKLITYLLPEPTNCPWSFYFIKGNHYE